MCTFGRFSSLITWEIVSEHNIDSNGLLEFSIDINDPDLLFPIEVSFKGYSIHSGINVSEIIHLDENVPIKFSQEFLIYSDDYQVV